MLVIGDKEVGKTSIISRYIYNAFDEQYKATLDIDISFTSKVINNRFSIQLWDIPQTKTNPSNHEIYYKNSCAVIFVIDITNPHSLQSVLSWKLSIDKVVQQIPMLLFANKVQYTHYLSIIFII